MSWIKVDADVCHLAKRFEVVVWDPEGLGDCRTIPEKVYLREIEKARDVLMEFE